MQVSGEDGPGGGFGGFIPQAGFDESLAGVAAALEDGAEAIRVVKEVVFRVGGGGGGGGVGRVGGGGFGDEIEEMERAPVVVEEEVASVEGSASQGDGDGWEFLDEFVAEVSEASAGLVVVHVFGWDPAGFPIEVEAMKRLARGGVPAGGPAGVGADEA